MEIKLDDSLLKLINSNYKIDPSVLNDIETRRQNSVAATNSIKTILESSPSTPTPPKKTDSTTDQIINNSKYEYELKDRQLNSILDLLSLSDASIDATSELIRQIDSNALNLVNEINNAIDLVNEAYQARIKNGCRSNLIWSNIGISTVYDPMSNTTVKYSNYTVIKDPTQKVTTNYYGIKYYQKPSNRDYGFNIISEVEGSIIAGSNSLVVVGLGITSNIQIGDEITDNLNTPVAFNIGSLPKVVGFGTTSLLGITTTVTGNVSLGSTIIAYTGIGSTENILIGQYVSNLDVFGSDVKVIGFTTTTTTIKSYNLGLGVTISSNVIVPGIVVDKVSISSVTNGVFGFSTYTDYKTINLSEYSNITVSNKVFTVIRNTEDITQNLSFSDNPLDPVTVGVIDSQRIGSGNQINFINNGQPTGPSQWRKILNETEPTIGAGSTFYYKGDTLWPYNFLFGYAQEGQIYNFDEFTFPTYVSISPAGISTNGTICNSYTTNITSAANNLQRILDINIPKIQKLISAVSPLRKYRDTDESKAWSYLQSASYLRKEMNELSSDISSLESFNYNTLEPS